MVEEKKNPGAGGSMPSAQHQCSFQTSSLAMVEAVLECSSFVEPGSVSQNICIHHVKTFRSDEQEREWREKLKRLEQQNNDLRSDTYRLKDQFG